MNLTPLSRSARRSAALRADGTPIAAEVRGSIHRVGAASRAPLLQRLDLVARPPRLNLPT
jgi:hypothetical protein